MSLMSRRAILPAALASLLVTSSLSPSAKAASSGHGHRTVMAAIHWPGNKVQFFLNDGTYVRYDVKADRADKGYPQPVTDKTWPGLGAYAYDIVAACDGPNGKAYFFLADGRYLRYDIAADRVDSGSPVKITDRNWPGLGRYGDLINGALNWPGNKIQFFLSNGQYIRYDLVRDRADDGYPREISKSSWPGVMPYREDLTGVINWENGKAYLFLQTGQYLRYDIAADRVDDGYPKPFDNANWPGLGN